jgi:drug/metabolite transporter (DMT)-like permease
MVVAALLNASSSVLQRRASRREPASAAFSLEMLVDLARRPAWALGVAAMISGFLLHAVSISVSSIALVQPVLVVELPFTLLLASRVFRLRIPRNEWLAIAMQSAGLAGLLVCLSPMGGDPGRVSALSWVIGIGVTVGVVVVLVILGYRGRGGYRAALLGVATGAAFGLNSSFIAGIGAAVGHGANLFATWQTYGVVILGPVSFYLLQNALHAGDLVASQPGFTLTNPLVSVAWGIVVFGEHGNGGLLLIGTVAGVALIAAGTVLLSRSELLNPAESSERSEKPVEEGT